MNALARRSLIVALTAAAFTASSSPSAHATQSYMKETPVIKRALIIGVEIYEKAPKVVNATNDAVGIEKRLQQLGFVTTLVVGRKNTHRDALIDAITLHVQSLKRDEISVIFFAGHGIEYGSSNFLVPSDAKNTDILHVTTDNVPVPLILRMIGGKRAGLSLVILDACRTSPFNILDENGRALSRTSGLAAMEAPVSTLIAFAAAPGRVAYSGVEGQGDSYYSRAFLQNIKTQNITLETLFKRTRYDVLAATSQRQQPWETTSLLGDLILQPDASVLAEQKEAWETLLQSEPSIELVARYIAMYPGSPWIASARRWLEDHPEAIPISGALANATADAPVKGALVSPTLSVISEADRSVAQPPRAVATGTLIVRKAQSSGAPVVGTLEVGDFVGLLSVSDVQGWAKVQTEQFGEGFVYGVTVDEERAKRTGRNARQIGEVTFDADGLKQSADLGDDIQAAWNDLLKKSTSKGLPSPVVEISPERSEQDLGERRARQLAFSRYLKARASLLQSGVEKDFIGGELSLATMNPGEKSIKVRAYEPM